MSYEDFLIVVRKKNELNCKICTHVFVSLRILFYICVCLTTKALFINKLKSTTNENLQRN